MSLTSKLKVLLIVLALSALGGAGAGEVFRRDAINNQMHQRDRKIEKATNKTYHYESWNKSRDEWERKNEIERINQEYFSTPPYEHFPFLAWGAGVGAVLGVGFYGLLKIKGGNDGGGDDSDNWSRTSGEYPLGAGR